MSVISKTLILTSNVEKITLTSINTIIDAETDSDNEEHNAKTKASNKNEHIILIECENFYRKKQEFFKQFYLEKSDEMELSAKSANTKDKSSW